MADASKTSKFAEHLRTTLDTLSSVAVIVAAAAVLWVVYGTASRRAPGPAPVPVPTEPIRLLDWPALGSIEGQVGILEFADFDCPYCRRFTATTLPELRAKYIDTGKVRLFFRQLPLKIHPGARAKAESAACAARQGMFWEVHNVLFSQADASTHPDVETEVHVPGLDQMELKSCVSTHVGAADVEADEEAAKKMGISGTPTFLIGKIQSLQLAVSKVFVGARQASEFETAIDSLLR